MTFKVRVDYKTKYGDIPAGHRLYELTYLVGLKRGDSLQDLASKIEKWIGEQNGKILEVEKEATEESKEGKGKFWVEKKRLAYQIMKERMGFFITIWFIADPSGISELKRLMKLENDIMRSLIIGEEEIAGIRPLKEMYPLEKNVDFEEKDAKETPEKIIETEVEEKKEIVPEKEIEIQQEKVEEVKEEPIEEKAQEVEPEPEVEINEEEVKEPEEVKEEVKEEEVEEKEPEKVEEKELAEEEKKEESKEKEDEEEKKEGKSKHKKISLDELDKKLDDLLNEDII